jgi:hypothetical protein
MALARKDDDRGGQATPPIPEMLEVCSADFEQALEWRLTPPTPTLAAAKANDLFYRILHGS